MDDTQAQAAWWYDIQFVPASDSVSGLAAHEIDADWERAMALSEDHIAERLSAQELRAFRESGLSFRTASDLDQDSIQEVVTVGVYAARDQTVGRFLAVFREGKLVARFTDPGDAGFSALLMVDGTVRWYKCMNCGEFETLRWTGRSYVLD